MVYYADYLTGRKEIPLVDQTGELPGIYLSVLPGVGAHSARYVMTFKFLMKKHSFQYT